MGEVDRRPVGSNAKGGCSWMSGPPAAACKRSADDSAVARGSNISLTATNETFNTHPKRKRGNQLPSLLTLWVRIEFDREQH